MRATSTGLVLAAALLMAGCGSSSPPTHTDAAAPRDGGPEVGTHLDAPPAADGPGTDVAPVPDAPPRTDAPNDGSAPDDAMVQQDAQPPCTGGWAKTQLAAFGISGLSAAIDAEDGIHLAAHDDGSVRARYYYRPSGGGWISTTLPIANDVAGYGTAVAVDAALGVHVFHAGDRYEHKPAGGSFTTQSTSQLGLYTPAMSVSADGSVHVGGYQHMTGSDFVRYLKRSPAGTWTGENIESSGSITYIDPEQYAFATETSIGVDSGGTVRIMYLLQVSNDPMLRLATRTGTGWSVVDFAAGDASSMRADGAGVVHASFRSPDFLAGRLMVGTQAPGEPAATELVGEPDLLLGWTALVLDGAGTRHVAYAATPQLNNSTSKVRYATRAAGAATWTFENVDTSSFGVRQTETKLVVDQAGAPHVFFTALEALYVVERCQ